MLGHSLLILSANVPSTFLEENFPLFCFHKTSFLKFFSGDIWTLNTLIHTKFGHTLKKIFFPGSWIWKSEIWECNYWGELCFSNFSMALFNAFLWSTGIILMASLVENHSLFLPFIPSSYSSSLLKNEFISFIKG